MNLLEIILEDWQEDGDIVLDRADSYGRNDTETSVQSLNRYHLNIGQFIDMHS